MGSHTNVGLSSTTVQPEYFWKPDVSDYRNLMWTVFPAEIGFTPKCIDIDPPSDLDTSLLVPMHKDLKERLMAFSVASALSLPELARRLLEVESFMYGPLEVLTDGSA